MTVSDDAPPEVREARPDPTSSTARRRVRFDPVALALAAGSLVLSAGFVTLDLVYNQGRLIAPLDDAYIHLQYGRQFGSGLFLQYNTGDPVSTGASSLLYTVVLGVVWALGVHGTPFLLAAIGLGALAVAATTVLVLRLGTLLVGRGVGIWAGVLTAVNGPLLWGATSGMEVGLTALLVTATVLAFAAEQQRLRFVWTPLLGVLLALARPEGLLVDVGLVLGMLWVLGSATRVGLARGTAAGRAVVVVLPLLVGSAQVALYRVLTGSGEANGILAKSWWHQGEAPQPTEVADHALGNVQALLSTLSGLDAQDLVPPGTGALAVIGLVALGLRGAPRWRTFAAALGIGLGLVLVSVSTLITALWQNLRYIQPFLPLVLLLAVVGVHALVGVGLGVAADADRRRVALHGLLAVGLVFSLATTPTWALRLAQQAATIREAPVSIGNWLAGHVPPGSVVAANDVGAVAYFSGHPVFDVVGLTTEGVTDAANNGPGTLYEKIAHLPPSQRPAYFSIYAAWGGVPVQDLARSGVLGDEPIISFYLKSPARPITGFAPPPCQTDRVCDVVNVWKADWDLVDSGAGPDRPVPGVVRDRVNVGDLDDETAHGWAVDNPVLGLQPASDVTRQTVAPGRTVVDSSRHVVGGESFTLHHLVPGRPVVLTTRVAPRADGSRPAAETDASIPSVPATASDTPPKDELDGQAVALTVGDRPAGRWYLTAPGSVRSEGWVQAQTVIPGELVTGPDVTIRTGPLQTFLGPYPDYWSYGYWASQ